MPKGVKGFQKGYRPPQRVIDNLIAANKNRVFTDEDRKRISEWAKGNKSRTGQKQSKEEIEKRVAKLKGKKRNIPFGEKSPNWRGGTTTLIRSLRTCFEYRQWRSDVFKRDEFTCTKCGDNRGGNLEADHIVPFSFLIKKYGLVEIENSRKCSELWDINNGRTLCKNCHVKTKTWGSKSKKYIPNIY